MGYPSQNSMDYYRDREQHEIKLAENAASPAIRNIHLEMAESYRKQVELLASQKAPMPDPPRPIETISN